MNQRQKIAFGIAVLAGAIFCAALAMGKFSPPPEEVSTVADTKLIVAAQNVVTIDASERRVIRIASVQTDSEELGSMPSNYFLDLLDTTSPPPALK